ncbi:hypothetical protein [Nonomuraea dietziae]|uniref:hypothetical protein n=1 Tax=Nonomuraea dietziae TaxID=65515 RepID=UPI003386B9DB
MSRWNDLTGGTSGKEYAGRFEALAATGKDVHGEAACAPRSSRRARASWTRDVAQAGSRSGWPSRATTSRAPTLDPSMLDVARAKAPGLTWIESDLADLDLDDAFDLVVAGGQRDPAAGRGRRGRTPSHAWRAR